MEFAVPIFVVDKPAVALANFKASLIVLTEDKIIKDYVDGLGVECFLTDKFHKNGTSRILEILEDIDSDFIMNLQGDEPLINPIDLKI